MEVNKEVLRCWKLTEKRAKRYNKNKFCNHRYPYVMRWYDDISKSGKMIERHCYCFICEKEFIVRYRFDSLHEPTFGYEKGRETIAKIKKQLSKNIIQYIKNVNKEFIEVAKSKPEVSN